MKGETETPTRLKIWKIVNQKQLNLKKVHQN